jgi:hypothetical protein
VAGEAWSLVGFHSAFYGTGPWILGAGDHPEEKGHSAEVGYTPLSLTQTPLSHTQTPLSLTRTLSRERPSLSHTHTRLGTTRRQLRRHVLASPVYSKYKNKIQKNPPKPASLIVNACTRPVETFVCHRLASPRPTRDSLHPTSTLLVLPVRAVPRVDALHRARRLQGAAR